MRTSSIHVAVQAPPDLPVTLQVSRLRRLGLPDATARVIVALAFGETSDSWRFTAPEASVQGVQNV